MTMINAPTRNSDVPHGMTGFIPIDLFARAVHEKDVSGYVCNFLLVWCCFYDPESESLYVATDTGPPEQGEEVFYSTILSRCDPVADGHEDKFMEHAIRFRDKQKEGYKQLIGKWYIDPHSRRVVEPNLSRYSLYEDFAPLALEKNGFPSDQPSLDRVIRRTPEEEIFSRLADANPVRDSWFFTN